MLKIVRQSSQRERPARLSRRAYARNVRPRFLYRQYTDLFIFRFISQHCLRSTQSSELSINWSVIVTSLRFDRDEMSIHSILTINFFGNSSYAVHHLYLNTAYAAHKVVNSRVNIQSNRLDDTRWFLGTWRTFPLPSPPTIPYLLIIR